MGRGASPLRTIVRNSPKKPAQENMDAGFLSVGELTPTRKPLSSIAECGRNPLSSSDENLPDASTPKGKLDATTPKAKKKSGGQCLFPFAENVDRSDGVSGTPDKQHGNGKNHKKSQSRQPSPMKTQAAVTKPLQENPLTETSTGAEMAGEISQSAATGAATAHLVKGPQFEQHGHTPRSNRNERGSKLSNEAEVVSSSRPNSGSSLQPSATPAKSVTRTLKYGAAGGPTVAGLPTSRAIVPLATTGRNMQPGTSEQHFELEEDHEFWHDHNVQVLIRTRPMSTTEVASQGFSRCLKQESPHTITWVGPPESRFTFDHVAGEIVTQEKLFKVAGLPMVENCMAGYNSCMFAYGQTGSGKTHTMLGDIDHLGDKPSDNRGMTPRVFEYLFSRIHLEEEQRSNENLKFLTKCSFLEIYNEQITDLLEPSSTNLQMREDARKGVYVEGLTEIEVHSVQDVIQLLLQGSANRKVAATNMNRESSRSHSVFTCIIESKWESESMTNIRFGRLNLVDLAGSERQKTSGAEGERLKEAANINKSLSTLGLVIMILVDVANGKQRHVPYRDSKLTFLLQDSLGGNSKTTIIATVSPSSCNALETLSTLKFAQRAKLIRNTAVVNEDASGDVKVLRAQIQQMKEELDRLRRQSISRIPLSQDDFNPVRSSFDSWGDANKFFGSPQVSNRKVRQMEAVVAGALRREQAADVATKRLAAEIEQLNRLVHQREADTQSSKMILRFREDKIRRLETLSKGLLSVDSYLAEEKNMLMEEIQLMREKVDRNPELTRFAMENIRLLDQLRSVQEYHNGGEREVMLEEIANLRDQLLEVLDGKIAVDQGLVPLTTPQKKALAPELASAARENELLRIEADNYRSEVEELRSNLSSSLEGYAKMGKQVDELQDEITKLKAELETKVDIPESPNLEATEVEQARQQELIADLRLQLEQSMEKSKMQESVSEQLDHQLKEALQEAQKFQAELEATKEAFESARMLMKKLQSKEAHLVAAQYTAAVKQIRLETEEMAVQQSQSLTNIQEMAVLWRMKETELREQLQAAHLTIEELSGRGQEQGSSPGPARGFSGTGVHSVGAEDGSFERLQRAQEIEMRHAEEVMQLQLELESLEAVLEEERAQRKEVEDKLALLDVPVGEAAGSSEAATQLQLDLATIQATLSEERSLRQGLEEKVEKLLQQLQDAQEVTSNLNAEEVRQTNETTYFDAVSRLQMFSPDQKSSRLCEQLDHEKALVEALESQNLLSIQEFEALQCEHDKAMEKLKRREERERILRKKIERLEFELVKEQELRALEREYAEMNEDDEEKLTLEKKLEAAKRELEVAHTDNVKLKEEELEKDVTRCQAESETVLAITSMQSEILNLKDEAESANKELAAAREQVVQLTNQLDNVSLMLATMKEENLQLVGKYEALQKEKDTLIDYSADQAQALNETDHSLNEASHEMEQIFSYFPPLHPARSSRDGAVVSRTAEKKKAVEQLKQQLQHAQELAKDTEGRVRVLSEAAFAMATAQLHGTPQKQHMETLQSEMDLAKRDFEKSANAMSIFVRWLSDVVLAKEEAATNMSSILKERELDIERKEEQLLSLQVRQETDLSILRESEKKLALLGKNLEEANVKATENETRVSDLGREVTRLQLAMEVLETEKMLLCEEKLKSDCQLKETSSVLQGIEEHLAELQFQLKESEVKAADAAKAQESLTVAKEEWEVEKVTLQNDLAKLEQAKMKLDDEILLLREEVHKVNAQSDELQALSVAIDRLETEKLAAHDSLARLQEEKAALDANVVELKEQLAEVREQCNILKCQLNEKEELVTLKDESERLSCMSIKKEEEKSGELHCELEAVRAELKHKELRSKDLESELSEAVKASELLVKEGDEKFTALEQGRVELSELIEKREQELAENKKELDALQRELQVHQNQLKQAEEKTLETLKQSQNLIKEKDQEIALLKEEGTRMSCMSVKKEEAEVVEMKKEVEMLREDLQRKETSLQQIDTQLLEALEIANQKNEQMTVLKEEIETLISMNAKLDIELAECNEELQMLQVEKESHDLILQEAESRVVQEESASEKLKEELEAVKLEIQDLKSLEEKSSEVQSAFVMKDEQIKELEGELERLSTRSAEHEKELAECKSELQALLLQVEEKDSRLQEAEKCVNQAVAASKKLTGEKEALEVEVENLILAANDTSVRLSEAEQVRSSLQVKITDIEMRMAELENREQSLIMEIDMLSSVNKSSVTDVQDLEQEVLKLKEERDRLTLEVSSMDMQGAISDRLQFIQTLCIDTDDRITSMQSEIDELTSARDALEAEVQAIEAHASRLLLELAEKEQIIELSRNHQDMDASSCLQADTNSREDLMAAQTKLHAAEESILIMARTIEALNKTKAEKEEMFASLQERLEKAKANRNQAQDKLNALTVAMHEFSVLEESWRNEKENILSEIEDVKSQLTEKEAECLAVQEKSRILEVRLQELEVKEAGMEAELAALENNPKEVNALLNDDQVELAKTQAALAGAEERVKLLVDANATMRDDWEGERSRLNVEKELLQLEISRLENTASTPLMENRAMGVDAENSSDQFIDELKREIKRTRADCENLRIKTRDRDDTILSVRLELEKAAVALKETNIEIEKYIREKEDALRRIAALDVELEDARKEIMRQEEQVFKLEVELEDSQKEIMRREEEVYKFEVELDSVIRRVADSESQWSSKMDELEREREEAQLEAYTMAEKFETLKKEMEDAQAASGEESPAQKQSMQELEDSVNLSLESIAAIASAKEEVDITKDHCEKEMETLAVDMQSLRADISNSFFEFPVVEIQQDVKSIIEGHRVEIATLTGKVKSLEGLLAESNKKVSSLEADLEEAQRARASLEAAEKKIGLLDAENSRKELEMSEAAVTELLAAVSERDISLSVLRERLEQTQSLLAQAEARLEASHLEVESAKVALNETEQLRSHVQSLQSKVAKKEEFIKGLEYDINLLEETGCAETEQKQEIINQLQKEVDAKKDELEVLKNQIVIQETQLREMKEELVASKAIAARAAEESIDMRSKLESRVALLEANVEENDCTVNSLNKELQATRTLLQENEADAAKARESAEIFKTYATSRSQEVILREEELKTRVVALEKKVAEQLQMRENAEKELRQLRQQKFTSQAVESREAQAATLSLERKVKDMEGQLSLMHQKLELTKAQCDKKEAECVEKDSQINVLKTQISQVPLSAGKHFLENHQKVKGLEVFVEQVNTSKSLARTASMGHHVDYSNADFAAKRRIEELEALAEKRLREVYALNMKLAETESIMHDVIREIAGEKLDIENYKAMISGLQPKDIVATVRRQSLESQEKGQMQEQEVHKLRKQLNELIEERASWLEEIQRRQAEVVAFRVTAEKLRHHDEILTAENDKLKTHTTGQQKRIGELEQEIKKLSGQQNLQQRIHHHAKIKDENNTLRLQVEELGNKLRRSDMMFARVKDELERYRIGAGKTPFPNIDEEQRLKTKLQEAEEAKIQVAQKFITLSNAVLQAAGIPNPTRQVDQSAALEALRRLESRLRSTEDELSEMKLKTRIAGERRRLTDLRGVQTPVKGSSLATSPYFYSSPAHR